MKPHLYNFSALLLVLFLAALDVTLPVRAQTASVTSQLHQALSTLAQADHDYQGHRVAAMKEIHLALKSLNVKSAAKRTGSHIANHTPHVTAKKGGTGNGTESQSVSDAQLQSAQSILQQVSGEVSGVTLQHVSAALSQLSTALSIR